LDFFPSFDFLLFSDFVFDFLDFEALDFFLLEDDSAEVVLLVPLMRSARVEPLAFDFELFFFFKLRFAVGVLA